ncbi:SDR family oxidoreductase [Blastococcus brunescens]|uniref:SDR family oxidoreductase n=1 Tax=Blastococcus brunescens TaxID=1564165 RepID=UPI003BEF354E
MRWPCTTRPTASGRTPSSPARCTRRWSRSGWPASAPAGTSRRCSPRGEAHPLGFMGDGRDTAAAALFLASDEARFVTGTELIVDGGMSARCD